MVMKSMNYYWGFYERFCCCCCCVVRIGDGENCERMAMADVTDLAIEELMLCSVC